MSDNKKIQMIIREQGVVGSQANELVKAFGGPFEEAGKVLATYKDIEVTDATQTKEMMQARESRLILKRVRSTVEASRKDLKYDIVKQGRAIDGVARFIKEVILPAEQYLEQQEKFVHIQKEKKAAELKAKRIEILSKFEVDLSVYNLDDMDENQFNTVIDSLEKQLEVRVAETNRLEKERVEKEAADIKENERIRKENARLEKENAEAERKRKKDQEEADKKLKIEQNKAEEERKKRELLEAKQKAKNEAELRKKTEADKAERRAITAPDKEKLIKLVGGVEQFMLENLPAVKSNAAQKTINIVIGILVDMKEMLIKEAKEL